MPNPGQPYQAGNIKATWAQTMHDLERQFELWGIREWQVRPMREPDKRDHWQGDPAKVVLDYEQRGQPVHLEMGKHPYYAQNLRVIYFAIESLRLNEVRGLTDVVQAAYLQLRAPLQQRDPWEVFGLRPGASRSLIDMVYRTLAKERHPDSGGTAEAMAELNEAYEQLKAGQATG